jgi:hypothetical protein
MVSGLARGRYQDNPLCAISVRGGPSQPPCGLRRRAHGRIVTTEVWNDSAEMLLRCHGIQTDEGSFPA